MGIPRSRLAVERHGVPVGLDVEVRGGLVELVQRGALSLGEVAFAAAQAPERRSGIVGAGSWSMRTPESAS